MKEDILGDMELLKYALDAVHPSVLVLDAGMRVVFRNRAAAERSVGMVPGGDKLGDALLCPHAVERPEGCGNSPFCGDCEVRRIIEQAVVEGVPRRERVLLSRSVEGESRPAPTVVTAAPFEYKGLRLCLLCLDDVSELAQLRALLPICANCKRIRTGQDYWEQVEAYINTHLADIKFTHGICPQCSEKLYPELNDVPGDGRPA